MVIRRRLSRPRVLVLALAALVLLAVAPARAARLTGTVDHGFMGARETFDYVVSLGGGDGREPPDVSPLAADFDIVGRDRRSRFEEVDGRRVEVNEWVLTLAPRRTGILTVPGLTVSGMTSAPLRIEVVPAPPAEPPADQPLFVQVEAGDVAPYAQSLVPVVVRIFDSVGLRQGRLGELSADGASFTPQGEQRIYMKTIGKKRYAIIEQSFLMQPQKSGTVEIAPVRVEGALLNPPASAGSALPSLLGRSPFAPDFRDVSIRSRPLSVAVRPRPAGAEGWFLPARGVTLAQQWSAAPDRAEVGVALTRTLRLRASGASPNQLPPLAIAEVEGLRQYEDSSRADRVAIDGAAGAELVKTVSVVPVRPGRITLPAITVDWWNTVTGRQERAELPPATVDVAPAAGAAASAVPASAPVAGALPAVTGPQASEGGRVAGPLARMRGNLWATGAAMVLLLAAIAAGLLWRRAAARRRARLAPPAPLPPAWRQPSPRPVRAPARAPGHATAEAAERALVTACRRGNAPDAHGALLAWLRHSPGAEGAAFRTPKMAAAVRDLSQSLYGAQAAPWRGRAFLAAFRAEQRARHRWRRIARRPRIAPLYPTG